MLRDPQSEAIEQAIQPELEPVFWRRPRAAPQPGNVGVAAGGENLAEQAGLFAPPLLRRTREMAEAIHG